jgi:hypothetical protein
MSEELLTILEAGFTVEFRHDHGDIYVTVRDPSSYDCYRQCVAVKEIRLAPEDVDLILMAINTCVEYLLDLRKENSTKREFIK